MSRPSTVSSATLVRYSCARWIGFRVWKPTTRRPAALGERRARLGRVERQLGEGRLRAARTRSRRRRGSAASGVAAGRRRDGRRRWCGSTARPRARVSYSNTSATSSTAQQASVLVRRARRGRPSAPRRRRGRRAAPRAGRSASRIVLDARARSRLAAHEARRAARARPRRSCPGRRSSRDAAAVTCSSASTPSGRSPGAVDELAAVRRDQVLGRGSGASSRRHLAPGSRPSCSSLARTSRALSSGVVRLGVDDELGLRRAPRRGRRRR